VFKRTSQAFLLVCAMLVSFVVSAFATNVYDPIVTAVDASGLSTAAVAILAIIILIPLAFAGYKVVKRAISKV